MNLYLFEMILKFIRMIFIAFISFFNITLYAENQQTIDNSIVNSEKFAFNKIVLKEEQKKPTVVKKVQNTQQSTYTAPKNIPAMVSTDEYTGRLTGYGPDCAGCSGYGGLACKTREKRSFSLVKDGIYYTDSQYGKVRILAAATTKFRCGTIIQVTKPGMQPFLGIVLDTGGSMRQAWAKGNVWMDLAYASEASAGNDNLTGKNIKFSVQRWGW